VVVDRDGRRPRLVGAAELSAGLRAAPDFAGAALNVEGAVVRGQELLRRRGNGAQRDRRRPVTAIGALELAGTSREPDQRDGAAGDDDIRPTLRFGPPAAPTTTMHP
jgi:hypothetical protein